MPFVVQENIPLYVRACTKVSYYLRELLSGVYSVLAAVLFFFEFTVYFEYIFMFSLKPLKLISVNLKPSNPKN